MAADAANRGWLSWSAVQRVAGSVAAVSVKLGFVALGAGVLGSRSLLEVMEQTWSLVSGEDGPAMPRQGRRRHTIAERR